MTEPRDDGASGDVDLTSAGRHHEGDRQTVPRQDIHEVQDDAPPPAPAPAPKTLKGAAVVSARVIAGMIGLAVAAATLGAAVFVPLPSTSVSPPSIEVTPVAAEQQRVCAGPLLRLGDDTGAQATTASALGAPTITSGATEGEVEPARAGDGDTAADLLRLPGGEDGGAEDDAAPALLAASQVQSVSRGDFVGMAAAECTEPREDTWLVGGATTTGRTTLLTVVNPGEVPATIDISVYSDAGPVSAPGTLDVAIAPGEQRVFSVAGLAPGLASPVIRVQSTGALVVATLQQSTVRTLNPGGVEFITASAAPSTELSIPGVIFPDHELLESAITGEDYLDLNSAIRFYVPGEAQAHAVMRMVPVGADDDDDADAAEQPIEISVTLDPGRVTELPIAEFDAGRYVATITSDVPLVAGVRVARVNADGDNDFAWLPSAEAIEERAVVAVAKAANPRLTIFNPTADAAEVLIRRGDAEDTITVPAGGAVLRAVNAGAVYEVEGFDTLSLNVSYLGDGVIASHTVSPRAPASTPVVVYP